jgi:hypothetical protein
MLRLNRIQCGQQCRFLLYARRTPGYFSVFYKDKRRNAHDGKLCGKLRVFVDIQLRTTAFPLSSSASSSMDRACIRQGPHQEAQKSMSTGFVGVHDNFVEITFS